MGSEKTMNIKDLWHQLKRKVVSEVEQIVKIIMKTNSHFFSIITLINHLQKDQ